MPLHHGLRAAAGALLSDPYFSSTSLLLSGNGTNGGQNNTFVDSSTNNFTVTRSGNAAQGSFSPFSASDGRWSNYFDGSGDYLSVPDNAALRMGTGDFTIEFWIYFTSLSGYQTPLTKSYNVSGSLTFQTGNGDGKISIYTGSGGAVLITNNTAASANAWNHYALVRSGSTLTLFLNGSSVGTATNSTDFNSTGDLGIGSNLASIFYPIFGYLSSLRILKGTAQYLSNFTPSTSPLTAITNTSLLTCQSNRFKDNSSNAFTITPSGNAAVTSFSPFAPLAAYDALINSGSLTCYGGDITSASNAAFAFGTGDFTLECWTYPLQQDYSWMFDFRSGDYNQPVPSLYAQAGATYYYVSADTRITGSALAQMAWNHVAVSRVSGTTRLFINGAQTGSNYSDSTNYQQAAFKFNRNEGGATGTHIVSGVRVVKGTGLYSSNFSVPTTAPTAISGTSILLNFTNASILDSTTKNNLETVGNAQVDTSVKKFGTGSLKFDGTGDYCVVNGQTSDFAFGTGNFTIEFWLYLNSTSDQIFYDNRPLSTQTTQQTIYYSSGAGIKYYTGAANRINGSALSTGQWYHIALARSGTSTKLFVDGTQTGSTYTDSANYTNTSSRPVIGADGFNFVTNFFNGYIDDLRITKGVARYTSNFTPPAAQLPAR